MTANAIPLLHDVLDQARAGATVVTATRRLARSLQERYAARARSEGRKAWPAPAILPWSAWLDELWRAALYSEGGAAMPAALGVQAALALWERVIARSPEAGALLQVASTARAVSDAWEAMHAWQLDAAALEAHATDDTLVFLAWAQEFECACAREGWIDPARLPEALAGVLAGIPLLSSVALAGFDELTPQQQAFLEAYRRTGGEVLALEEPASAAPPRAIRAAFPDASGELAAAALWARALLEQGASSVAVVVPKLQELRPLVERLFSQVLDPSSALPGAERRPAVFNISASPALASYPLIHAALQALELEPAANDAGLVSRFVRSPFFGAAEEWTGRATLDARLRRMGGIEVSIARMERLSVSHDCPSLAGALTRWRRERDAVPARQRPAAWARTFDTLLAALGWPGGRTLSSAEYQCLEAWRETLSEFASLELVLDAISFSDARTRLARMARERMFQPETGSAPVQILGALETSGLRFEHLWIAGLDDESWPRPPKPTPFLPATLQRERGLPHATPARELAFTRALTTRMLSGSGDAVVSHALREGDRVLAASPLIRGIPEGEPAAPHYPLYRDAVRASSQLEEMEDYTAPPVEGASASGGTSVFRDQASCPFRAFAELRLGARPLEAPAPGLNPMERGNLVHSALECIWRELGGQARLHASSAEELSALIRSSIATALAAMEKRRGDTLSERFAALEAVRLERILDAWLALEKQRSPFTVLKTEAEREAIAGGVCCKVKVDRVDRLADGRDVVIDYKTGLTKTSSWTGERPDEPQLPLYAVTHDGPVAAVLFGQLRTGEIGFKGFAESDGIAPGAETRPLAGDLAEWRRVLDRLGSDFRAGVADVNPKDANACRRCSLLPLCRFGDVETPTSAFEGEGNGNDD